MLNSSPVFDGQAASVSLGRDDDAAKEIVSTLARDMGFDPVECGPLSGGRLRAERSHHSTETGYRASIRSPVTRERFSATA